jgi:plastocyanin
MCRVATLGLLALSAALAGCGSSSSGSSSSVAAASTSKLTLAESEFKISPATPRVARTGMITITVKNTGAVVHALAVQTPSGVVKTGPISPGASATLRVDAATAGRYTFFCPIPGHRQAGMQGVLVVDG